MERKVSLKIDRDHVTDAFKRYAENYDLNDVKVKLKYDHTFRVADLSDRIAASLGMDEDEKDLAWACGMFHDIGRFEQLKRYHTFQDKKSVNHAALSADILFNEGLVRKFIDDSSMDPLIEKAVRLHNVLDLPENLSQTEYRYCTILRDADKADILRVNCETPRTEIYDLPEKEFENSSITPEVYADVCALRNVDRKNSKTGIDFILGHICFVFGMVYPETLRITKEQGYLDKLLDFRSNNPDTRTRMENIRKIVKSYISEKCREA